MRAEAMSLRVLSSVNSVSLPCPSSLLAGPSLELRDCGGLARLAESSQTGADILQCKVSSTSQFVTNLSRKAGAPLEFLSLSFQQGRTSQRTAFPTLGYGGRTGPAGHQSGSRAGGWGTHVHKEHSREPHRLHISLCQYLPFRKLQYC